MKERDLKVTISTFLLLFSLFTSCFFLTFLFLFLLTFFCRCCLGFCHFSSLNCFLYFNLLFLNMTGVVCGEGTGCHQVGAGLETTVGRPAKSRGSLGVATGDASNTSETESGLLTFQQFPSRQKASRNDLVVLQQYSADSAKDRDTMMF